MICIIVAGKIKPMDMIWIIGEDFVENSARRCFAHIGKEDSFTHSKFGIKIFAAKSLNSGFRTTIARVRNCLANALSEIATPLPKILFIMLEDDVIKDVRSGEGLPHIYGRCVEWLHHEVHKMLAAHNDFLPANARRDVYVTWVLPSRHINYANDGKREFFSECIENVVEINNEKNFALAIKQSWDQYDPSIFLYDSQRYSGEGLNWLWRAFDRTVWYANVWVNKTEQRKIIEQNNQRAAANVAPTAATTSFRRGGRGNIRGRGGNGQGGNFYYANKSYFNKFGKNQWKAKLPPPPPSRHQDDD